MIFGILMNLILKDKKEEAPAVEAASEEAPAVEEEQK